MAHAVHTRDLGRNKSWRQATVRSLAQALLKRERIQTTRAKAKEAQRLTERLITLGKNGSLSARRRAISVLNDVDLVGRLFADIAPRFKNRAGGYTRILHQGHRAGDGAEMAWIELVELKAKPEGKPKERGKKEERTPEKEKPKDRPVKREEVRVREPKPATAEEPAKPEMKEPSETQKQLKKPKDQDPGFIGGLRKFFKRRDNP